MKIYLIIEKDEYNGKCLTTVTTSFISKEAANIKNIELNRKYGGEFVSYEVDECELIK